MTNSILAGFAKIDITPPLDRMQVFGLGYWFARCIRFTGVRDPLFVRALALGEGGDCQLIISVDAIHDSFGFIPEAESKISRQLRIPETNVFITCTHTHSAPLIGLNNTDGGSEYGSYVADRIVACAIAASGKRELTSVRLSRSKVEGALYNRRPLLRNGRIAELHASVNPDEIVDPGSVNDSMTLLKFRRDSGALVGAVCHFGIHGVAIQCSDLISSDCMGRAIQRAEAELDLGSTVLHLNGPCADIDPTAMGDAIALETMTQRLLEGIRGAKDAEEHALSATPQQSIAGSFRGRRRETRSPEMLVEAERKLANEADGNLSHHSGSGYDRYLIEEERAVSRMPQVIDISYKILRAGQLLWVGVGGEIFTVSGMALTSVARNVEILPVGITGVSKGYLPLASAYSQGGYEVAAARWCPIAPGETEKLFSQIERDVRAIAGAEGE